MAYQHILAGLDLAADDSRQLAERAQALAQALGARLSLIHVIEPLAFAYAGDIPVDLGRTQQAMQEHAETRLAELAAAIGQPPGVAKVVVGLTADELRHAAAELGADLIVVGSHGRHGLALLLGNTAAHVLRGAECDVLAMRIH